MGSEPLILLDTHALIWLDQDRLGVGANRLADRALQRGDLSVSAISFWELAMLESKGRLTFRLSLDRWRQNFISRGVMEVPVTGEIGLATAALTGLSHDPADRLIVATAQQNGAMLLTGDQAILAWGGRVQRHDARI